MDQAEKIIDLTLKFGRDPNRNYSWIVLMGDVGISYSKNRDKAEKTLEALCMGLDQQGIKYTREIKIT